jgi:hypothetical protein
MYGAIRTPSPSRRRRTLRRVLVVAIAAVAALVVVLLVLIAGGVLILPGHTTPPVTISYLQVRVIEGKTSGGVLWFGNGSAEKNYTGGYPLQVAPGSSFDATLFFYNYDTVNHTLLNVQASSIPKEFVPVTSTTPTLPVTILPSPESIEGQNFVVYVTIPSTPGATYVLTLNISAVPPP